MNNALDVLKKHWNFDTFRNPQEAIIQNILEGHDTFALLPTGGGKSICYQIPALLKPGIALIISPLVALMKDQVENLKHKDIKAIALTGGVSFEETTNLLDNCEFGGYKLLYVSPERLQQDWILERIKQLNINLVAIDEAHCISQWGHDFRPAYLKIGLLKSFFNVPFIALTATATPRVQEDICNSLGLEAPTIFKKSFARENLGYHIIYTEDKLTKLKQIFDKNPQPAIIYVRNRKSCLELSNQLIQLGYSSTYYHGGLILKEKEKNMKLWLEEKALIMVATNAFGMGIDKPNVKTVIHLQLPENIENYYQEAGRAGRNGEKAFAILLTHQFDITLTKDQFIRVLPDKVFLKKVYQCLNAYFQIAYGEGTEENYIFNLHQFCTKYQLPTQQTFAAIQFLDRQGILTFSNENNDKVKLQFLLSSKEIIRYCSLHTKDQAIIETILRTYPGIFEQVIAVNTSQIASKSNHREEQVVQLLQKLEQQGIISLQLVTNDSKLIFNEPREDDYTINRIQKFLIQQNEQKIAQFAAMIDFVFDTKTCKSILISNYFGETNATNCGICSTCMKLQKADIQTTTHILIEHLRLGPASSQELQRKTDLSSEALIFALQYLLDNTSIRVNDNKKYELI